MKKILLIACLFAGMALASCGGNSESNTGDSAVLDTATMESTDTLEARGPGVDPAAGNVELDSIKPDGAEPQGHGDKDATAVDSGNQK